MFKNSMKLATIASYVGLGLVSLALLFVAADCACGTRQQWLCVVSGRQYIAPWVEVNASTDSDGQTHVYTINHSAQWRLFCSELDGARKFDVNTTALKYNTLTNGQEVTVATRQGRWTGAGYLPTIVKP